MSKNKGFTLIELLAVIIVLGIVAVISVPVVNNIIRDAKKKVLDKQINVILESAKNWAIKNTDLLEENENYILVKTDTLKKEGFLENKTFINPVDNSEMTGCTEILYVEEYNQYEYKYNENCTIDLNTLAKLATTSEELAINNVDECATNGSKCTPGVAFAIKVNDTETFKFYVIEDEGNKVTLIMSENLGNTIAWMNVNDYITAGGTATDYGAGNNNKGPITAINYLDELTDDEWSNIPKRKYTYSGLAENGIIRKYEDITTYNRARMITYDEVKDMQTANNGRTPNYMYGVVKYWTSTANSSYASRALYLHENGALFSDNIRNYSICGVRPVIELPKIGMIY